MDTLLKCLLYLGTVTATGAGVFRWFVHPGQLEAELRRNAFWGLIAGTLVVAVMSPLQLVVTVTNLLGYFDPVFVREYLFATRHGRATMVRLIALLLVVLATVVPLPRAPGRIAFTLATLVLLGTFSWTSHAAAAGGEAPLLADLAHFAAAAAWAGAVLYAAWLPLWRERTADDSLVTAMERISGIGLSSVILLLMTGVYTALLHVQSPEVLTGSPYGQALILKNSFVAVILAIAGLNRWWLLPRLRRGDDTRPFSIALRAESLLLVAALAATGLLTTGALPHEAGTVMDPWQSLRNFLPR